MRQPLNLLLLVAATALLAGCACGNCGPTEGDGDAPDAGATKATEPSKPTRQKVDLSGWNDAELKKRIVTAGWTAGKCTVADAVTTCEARQGVVRASVALGNFDDGAGAGAHAAQMKKNTSVIHRDDTSVLSVNVDALQTAEALRKHMAGDGTKENLAEWGNRTLLLKIKNAGFKPDGTCKKTHEPGVSTWTCQVSGGGLEGSVLLELVPGAPHTSDNGKKIAGKAVLDQGDAALIITLEQKSAGSDLLDELLDR